MIQADRPRPIKLSRVVRVHKMTTTRVILAKTGSYPPKKDYSTLEVYFVKARQFKCRYDRATASFYRAFNAVFGKIGRSSSEEVVLQLINSKCMPCLLYALEACPINKTQE